MFSFAYPWLLLLFLPAALLIWYVGWWKPQPSLRFSAVENLAGLAARHGRRMSIPELVLIALALALLLLALARPRTGNELVKMRSHGIDMVLVTDVSGSMDAYDIPEDLTVRTQNDLQRAIDTGRVKTRLQSAQEVLKSFMDKRPNDRIGLVGFGTHAYSLSPPTLDHEINHAHLNSMETGMLGDSTNIAEAVVAATRRLADRESPRRVIVLFTDGENNIEFKITPVEAAELAKAKDVAIYTVGIGSDRAFFRRDTLMGSSYFRYESHFDEAMLRAIAEISGGRYFHADDASGLEEAMNEINQLEKTSVEQPKYVEYREYAPQLALAALAVLMLLFVLQSTVCMRCP